MLWRYGETAPPLSTANHSQEKATVILLLGQSRSFREPRVYREFAAPRSTPLRLFFLPEVFKFKLSINGTTNKLIGPDNQKIITVIHHTVLKFICNIKSPSTTCLVSGVWFATLHPLPLFCWLLTNCPNGKTSRTIPVWVTWSAQREL